MNNSELRQNLVAVANDPEQMTAFGFANSLIQKASELMKEHLDLSEDAVAQLVTEVYRSFFAPIDLKHVPNIVEPMVDTLIERALEVAVRRVYRQLHGTSS